MAKVFFSNSHFDGTWNLFVEVLRKACSVISHLALYFFQYSFVLVFFGEYACIFEGSIIEHLQGVTHPEFSKRPRSPLFLCFQEKDKQG